MAGAGAGAGGGVGRVVCILDEAFHCGCRERNTSRDSSRVLESTHKEIHTMHRPGSGSDSSCVCWVYIVFFYVGRGSCVPVISCRFTVVLE